MYFIALRVLGFTLGFGITLLHVIGTRFVIPIIFAGGNFLVEAFDTEQTRGGVLFEDVRVDVVGRTTLVLHVLRRLVVHARCVIEDEFGVVSCSVR